MKASRKYKVRYNPVILELGRSVEVNAIQDGLRNLHKGSVHHCENNLQQEIDIAKELIEQIERAKGKDPENEPEEKVDRIKDLLREALYTDGAHHKQWYLEEIGKACGINLCHLPE